jgi:hypothetical protein
LSLRPTSRRCVFCSMNWYFLEPSHKLNSLHARGADRSSRNHLLEAVHRALHLGAIGNIVFYAVDEGCDGDAARVGRRIFASDCVRRACYVALGLLTCLASVRSSLWSLRRRKQSLRYRRCQNESLRKFPIAGTARDAGQRGH